MPSRFLSLCIVACWIATSSWLLYRDVWWRLWLDETPPFTIDLAQEAAAQPNEVEWTVFRNRKTIGTCTTRVEPCGDDTYALRSRYDFTDLSVSYADDEARIDVHRMRIMERVTPAGELREIDNEISGGLRVREARFNSTIRITGRVEDNVLTPHCTFEPPLPSPLDKLVVRLLTPPPVELKPGQSVLNPSHPWNRLLKIQIGKRWQLTLFDPLSGLTAVGRGPTTLEAGVLEMPEERLWSGRSVLCWVIECRGDKITARTWVRVRDGLVLRQEVTRGRAPQRGNHGPGSASRNDRTLPGDQALRHQGGGAAP